MARFSRSFLILVMLMSVVWPRHRTIIFAQTLPASLHAQWTPNPVTENVTAYVLTLDAEMPVTILPVVCTAVLCETTVSVSTFGSHTVTLIAQNQQVSGDPASGQSSPAATVTFTLSQAPGQVGNVRVKK